MSARDNQQIINFDQLDETSPIQIYSRAVVIQPSARTLESDSKASNKITTQNMVDYSWEDRYSLGRLISFHGRTGLIAYVLSISNNYMIRILNEQHSARCLIKDFSGEITDIAFSSSCVPYLASIDINGSVKVNKVNIIHEIIECQLILHIKPISTIDSAKSLKVYYSRVMWCWHCDNDQRSVEESETVGTNISLLLGVVHGSTCEIMQIDTIENELLSQADGGQYEPKIDRAGLKAISNSFQDHFFGSESLSDLFLPYLSYTAAEEDAKITSLAISSDAAAFAVALRDGTVRFFTLDGSAPSGLKEAYSWKPFNGEAVWSLLFLDDCRPESNIDSYWCHVIVGSAFNRELKLFRCDKWDCIQTVSFQSQITPCLLSAHIDQSARYLIMSDIRRKALYVLELDSIDNGKTKLFKNVQEFVLTQSLLSFDINTINCNTLQDGSNQIVIKMFTITKEAFQKMRVSYISRGHRLNEILIDAGDANESVNDVSASRDLNDDDEDNDGDGIGMRRVKGVTSDMRMDTGDSGDIPCDTAQCPAAVSVSASLMTHVSSLPSANSSFQDPAIISTSNHILLSGGGALPGIAGVTAAPLKSLPIDMSPTLKHLFSGAMEMSNINHDRDAPPARTDESGDESGDESEDEASLVDLLMKNDNQQSMQHKNINMDSKLYRPDHSDGCEFPLPPTKSCVWNETPQTGVSHGERQSPSTMAAVTGGGLSQQESSRLSRIEYLLERQSKQMDSISRAVQELQRGRDNVPCPNCSDSKKLWTEQFVREITAVCRQTITDKLDHRIPEEIGKLAPRLSGEVNSRLEEAVRHKLISLEAVMREFVNEMLRDKKFLGFLGNSLCDSLDKPLRSAYSDAVKRDLVPGLQRSLDKLFADTREILREGIKDVLGSVSDSNKTTIRHLEEKLLLNISTSHKNTNAELEARLKQMTMEMSGNRGLISEGFNKQRDQITKLTECVNSVKKSITANTDHLPNHDSRNHNVPGANSLTVGQREIKINRLISTGDLASALNEALSMTDMRILLSVCARVNTKQVLAGNPGKPSLLQSSSILALIQQLSRDFNEQFDLKFEYLFDALLSLDTTEPGIKGHVNKVLKGVIRRLETHQERESIPIIKDKITVLLRLVTSRVDSTVSD